MSRWKLTDLDADFIGKWSPGPPITYQHLPTVDGAQGVLFQCPLCADGKERGEEVDSDLPWRSPRRFVRGAHGVLCWFRNPKNAPPVPDDADPKPGRWFFEGETLDDLTFVGPGAFSVLLTNGCGWHGFVNGGFVE